MQIHELSAHVSELQRPLDRIATKLIELASIKQLLTLAETDKDRLNRAFKLDIDYTMIGCKIDYSLRDLVAHIRSNCTDYSILLLRRRQVDLEAELAAIDLQDIYHKRS